MGAFKSYMPLEGVPKVRVSHSELHSAAMLSCEEIVFHEVKKGSTRKAVIALTNRSQK